MRIVDPIPYGDLGLRRLVVAPSERAALLRAVAILERGHEPRSS